MDRRSRQEEVLDAYHEACSRGDAGAIASLCTAEVVHYFTDPALPAVRGDEHLGRYWRKVQRLLSAEWRAESILHGDREAAVEWAMEADDGAGGRVTLWGTDWFRFEGGLIAEVRAYFRPDPAGGGLTGFPYAERGPKALPG